MQGWPDKSTVQHLAYVCDWPCLLLLQFILGHLFFPKVPWFLCFPDFVPSYKHPIMSFTASCMPLNHKIFYTVPSTPWVCFHSNLASPLLISYKFVLNVPTAALSVALLLPWKVLSLRLSLLSTDHCSLHVCVFNFPIFCFLPLTVNSCWPGRYLHKSDSFMLRISLHTNTNRSSKWSKNPTSLISIMWGTELGL